MMIRGDQHVDDWAEVAVDYLDGRLDPEARGAVESHLAGCPDCSARLRKQQSVVRFLQETALDDPPEDLEYRAIGEIVFPSPGGQALARPGAVQKPARTTGWYRTFRAWIPATLAVVALLAAVTMYGIVRSGPSAEVATDSNRSAGGVTTMAASATTAAGATAAPTSAGSPSTTALAAGPPATDKAPVTVAATQDRKAMINALATTTAPAYVSFRAAVDTPVTDTQNTTTGAASGSASTAATGSPTTGVAATETTTAASGTMTLPTVSQDQAASIVDQIIGFTGLQPVDRSMWLGGPTFAAFLPRIDAEELVDLVRSIGVSLGLVVRVEGGPPATAKEASERLLGEKRKFPVLAAQRALQPAIWGYDFTTSSLAPASGEQSGTTDTMPDESGTHIIVVIWIAE
jgi:anti-sigma factor RsiW